MYGHIYYNYPRPDRDLLEAFGLIPTATISDAMGRHGALDGSIRPLFEGIRLVGSALTVLCFPGDNIMTHKALEMVQPDDVLVVDEGGHGTACFGHRSALLLQRQGGRGAVVSGSIRDAEELRRDRIPIFARSISPRAPQKNTAGSINVPIHVGGIVVCPGDIIVGDDDGLVAVPLPQARDVLAKAQARDRTERQSTAVAPGELPVDPAGAATTLDDLLRGKVTEHRETVTWRPGETAPH